VQDVKRYNKVMMKEKHESQWQPSSTIHAPSREEKYIYTVFSPPQ
jgi:hypothetical protein